MYRTGDLGCAGADATARSSASAAPTSRSRSAAIASSSARSRPRSRAIPRSRRPRSRPARTAPATSVSIGYIVARDGAPSDETLRAHLAETLPDYMIPARFVTLAALPLTPNGKVDRKALPAPSGPALANQGATVEPRTPTEEVVAAAFKQALALPRLSVHDDFFALGGHSLLVAQMTTKLSRTLGRVVPMRAGFEHPTVASLATWIDGAKARPADAPPTIPHRAQGSTAPLSLMQQRIWYLEQLQLGSTVFHVPSAHRLHGALDVDEARPRVRAARRAPAGAPHLDRNGRRCAGADHRAARRHDAAVRGSQRAARARSRARAPDGSRYRAAVRSRARPAVAREAVQARGRSPRAVLHAAPHHLGRLVVRSVLRGDDRALRRHRAARAGGDVRRLRRVASRLDERARARAPARALEGQARRRARRTRSPGRSPAPADADRRRRDRVVEAAARDRGEAARGRPPRRRDACS